MKWHAMDLNAVIGELGTSSKGLTKNEASIRLENHGLNKIDASEGSTIWQMIIGQFVNPLIIILILACIVSFFTGEFIDGIAIIVIVLVNAIMGIIQEYKAEGALAALREMSAPIAKVIREGIRKGELKPLDPREMAYGIAGMINSFIFHWMRKTEVEPLSDKGDTLTEMVLGGLRRVKIEG